MELYVLGKENEKMCSNEEVFNKINIGSTIKKAVEMYQFIHM